MSRHPITIIIAALITAAPGQQLGQLHFPEESERLVGRDITVDLTKLTGDDDLAVEDAEPAATEEEYVGEESTTQDQETGEPDDGVRVSPSVAHTDEPEAAKEEERGVQISVSAVSGKLESVDPGQISIKAPFPAKPLTPAPAGWKLVRSEDPEAGFEQAVEITPGTGMKLTIRPHVLVPDSDGTTTFAVIEPGFQPSLQYRQADTVGCLLGNSIRHLKEDDAKIGESIRRLEQLLVSLPNPEP